MSKERLLALAKQAKQHGSELESLIKHANCDCPAVRKMIEKLAQEAIRNLKKILREVST